MGRPPIGKRALTDAEKQKAYRERLKAKQQREQRGAAAASMIVEENDRLKAENARLRAEQRKPKPVESELQPSAKGDAARIRLEHELQAAKMQLSMAQRDLQRQAQAGAPSPRERALLHENTMLKGQVAHWKGQAKPKIESEEIARRDERIRKLRVEIHTISDKLHEARTANPVTITKADHRKLSKVFHPDSGKHASEKLLNEAIQIFNGLRFHVTDE